MNQPDPKRHLQISLVKSAFRVVAGASLISGMFVLAGVTFILAEVLGILEELV